MKVTKLPRVEGLGVAATGICAILSLSVILAFFQEARAGERSGTVRADSTGAVGVFARAAESRTWLDRAWGGSGGGVLGGSSSTRETDLDNECRLLRPFFGCAVDTIIVSGNTRTREIAILREMATKQGEPLDERLIRRDSSYLRGLGYFADVSVKAEPAANGAVRVLVAVTERPGLFMRYPYPVVNYDFEKGVSYGFTWKVKNFRGLAENLSLSAMMRRDKDRGASFSWGIPWLLGKRLNFSLGAYTYERLDEPAGPNDEYVDERSGASLNFGLPLSRNIVKQLWLRTGLSFDNRYARLLQTSSLDGQVVDFYRQNFISAHAEILFDSRTNRLSSFDGMRHRIWARRTASVSGLEQEYIFYGFFSSFYVPVGPERSFIFAVDSDIREGDLTTLEEMKLGGLRDLRGYENDGLRGTAKLVCTVQYRMKLIGPKFVRIPRIGDFDYTVNGVAFVESGELTDSILDMSASAFHSTAGLGLEIISPFRDLVRLEVAADAHGSYDYYLTAGTDF